MKEKKVIVSVRLPLSMLAEVDKYACLWWFRDRSKAILYAIKFFLANFTPEDWVLYDKATPAQVKVAWDLFWSALRSPAVKSNTIDCHDSSDRP